MPGQPCYGKRLSAEEFERRVAELHRGLPPAPTPAQEREVRRRELDLSVDHRLGTAFPAERRRAMWTIQEEVERRRGRLALRHLLDLLVPGSLDRGSTRLADYLISEYSKVLDDEELARFLGDDGPPSAVS
jgi:hypothetical protein